MIHDDEKIIDWTIVVDNSNVNIVNDKCVQWLNNISAVINTNTLNIIIATHEQYWPSNKGRRFLHFNPIYWKKIIKIDLSQSNDDVNIYIKINAPGDRSYDSEILKKWWYHWIWYFGNFLEVNISDWSFNYNSDDLINMKKELIISSKYYFIISLLFFIMGIWMLFSSMDVALRILLGTCFLIIGLFRGLPDIFKTYYRITSNYNFLIK
ncbi:MAG: hypothetical protein ABIJ47_14395 [Candidatus Bathyarchaeota archaeon]